MMRIASAIVLGLCSMWLACQPAFAERRVALVIGNSHYERVPLLNNPVNDATSMSDMFKTAGFDVVKLKLDAKASEMRRALRDFSDEASHADVAIIYFAGHGIEVDGVNYLVPVDAVLERDMDAYDEAISLDRLLAVTEPARQLRLVILDACRDNPFVKNMKHALASRGVQRGLAKIEPDSPNTLIAFAAKAGSTAADGNTKNSPFTTALVKYLPTPGLDLRKAFGFVRDDVLTATHNRQEPFIYGSLGGNDVALVSAPPAPIVDSGKAVRDDFELASQINVVSAWDAFIRKYPSGFYSDLASAQRDKLIADKASQQQKALADAKADEAERARIAAEAKAAEARLAADKAKAAEEAKAAEAAQAEKAREDAERQKALAEAKAAEEARRATEKKAAEEARLAAEKKAADEAKAAEEARRLAVEKKAAEEARLAAERKAAEEAKAAEAARIKAAQAATQLAAILPGDGKLGQEAKEQEQRSSSPCTGISLQSVSLSSDASALSLSQECALKPKDVFKECQNCPEMVVIPAGEFVMGSSKDEIESGRARANEGPQRKVVLKQPIAVGRFEVTRDQYAAFVNSTGYKGSDRCFTFEQNTPKERENRSFLIPGYAQEGNHPVVCVSWTDAQAYVDWLSRTTGKSYRLPSEAEYEYAARAGSVARYGVSDDPAQLCYFANGADQSAKIAGLPADADYMACRDGFAFTAPVGSLAPNAFGLYDVIGNVWEWSADCFADDYTSAGSDSAPRAQASCSQRSVRGGDWFSAESSLRPAIRAKASPDAHFDDIGFRVVRILAR